MCHRCDVRLMILKLTPPGTSIYLDREGALIQGILDHGWLNPAYIAGRTFLVNDEVVLVVRKDDADDLAQEAIASLIRKIRSGGFRTIRQKYVTNAIGYAARKRAREDQKFGLQLPEDMDIEHLVIEEGPQSCDDTAELLEKIRKGGGFPKEDMVKAGLTDEEIYVIDRRIRGATLQEIAREKEWSVGKVFNVLVRALKKLARYFTGEP